MTLIEVVISGVLMVLLGGVLVGLLSGHASVLHSARLRSQTYLQLAAAAGRLEADLRAVRYQTITNTDSAGALNKIGFPTPVDASGRVVLDEEGQPVYQAYIVWYGYHNHLKRRRLETGPFKTLSSSELEGLCTGEGTDHAIYSGGLKLYAYNSQRVLMHLKTNLRADNGLKDEQNFAWTFYVPQ